MNLGTSQRSMPMDPSSLYSQGIMQSKPGLGNAGEYNRSTWEIFCALLKELMEHSRGISMIIRYN